MEHETMKLKQQEEAYSKELKEWKSQLKPRKQVFSAEHVIFIMSKWLLWVARIS